MHILDKKLIMLDFDGTIARLLDLYDLDKVRDELEVKLKTLGLDFNNTYKCFDVFEFADKLEGELRLKALEIAHNTIMNAEYDALNTSIEVLGFRDFIKYAKDNNIILAISTSNPKEVICKYLIDHNIDDVYVVGREMYSPSRLKPSPWSLEHIMDKYNISKSESLYIGDNPNDYYAAKNAKVDFLGMAPTDKKVNRFIKFNKDILFFKDYIELLEYYK